MSFLSRLGLKSVSFSESNHGQLENQENTIAATTTSQDNSESEDEIPEPIMLNGAILQHDSIIVFPGFEVHIGRTGASHFVNEVRLYQLAAAESILLARYSCDFFLGFNTQEGRKVVNNIHILSAGTHIYVPDPDNDYVADYLQL